MRYIDIYSECKGCPVSKWCGTSNSGIKLCNSYNATFKEKIVFNFKKYYKKMKDILVSIKYFIIVFMMMFLVNIAADAQSFEVKGNNYTAVKANGKVKSEPEKTAYTWTDRKGNVYPIYISKNGSCFTIRTNSKGETYPSYLKPDVSQDICRKMGREYKSNKINK